MAGAIPIIRSCRFGISNDVQRRPCLLNDMICRFRVFHGALNTSVVSRGISGVCLADHKGTCEIEMELDLELEEMGMGKQNRNTGRRQASGISHVI